MASPIEEEQRREFLVNAFRRLGHTLVKIHEHRENGPVPLELHEVIGEGSIEVPIQMILDKGEINPPSKRLETLRAGAKANQKRIVIAAVAGTGVVIATIGTILTVKHFIDKDPQADITDN